MHLAIRPGPGAQLPLGNQFCHRRFHFRRALRDFLFSQPPFNYPSQRVIGLWILGQIVENPAFNWRFTLQCQALIKRMRICDSICRAIAAIEGFAGFWAGRSFLLGQICPTSAVDEGQKAAISRVIA